ncbi:MAG: outer membrane beta-barrel protein [Planctomycetaceae bacterium]
MVKRSWKALLAGAALCSGFVVGNPADAGDTHYAAHSEAKCQKLFASGDSDLTVQLASLSCLEQSCCAPDGCSDDATGCGEGCGEGCDPGEEEDEGGLKFGGWIQMGYHSGVVPRGVVRNDLGSFNNHPHRLNLHQGWLYAEKVADGSEGLDWGFRVDGMYGVDASDTQAFGNNPGRWDFQNGFDRGAAPGGYGFAIPQAYVELAKSDWSVKVGHFYTLIGYEVVTAPDNFFYSHALTMFNSEPFTHTGAIATYSASDDVTLYGGWTAGWDTGFDQLLGGSNFLGGFSAAVTDDVKFTYMTTAGNFGWRGAGATGYSHSLLLDTSLTDDLNLILQSDLVRVGTNDDIGINSYLIKTVNDKIGVGTRAEWWKRDGISQYAVTYGVNIKPMDNLIIRPEMRHDWKDPTVGAEDTFGVDAIITF